MNTVPILDALYRIINKKYFEKKIPGTNISSRDFEKYLNIVEKERIQSCLESPYWQKLLSLITFDISYDNSVILLSINYNNPSMLKISISGNYSTKFTTEIKTLIINPNFKEITELCQIIESIQKMFNHIMPSDSQPIAQVVEVIR
jgi:hypothetical protein